MKLKMAHKGLILVSVPLIYGTALILLLCFGLANLDQLVRRELLLKDAIVSHLTALRSSAAAHSMRAPDPEFKKLLNDYSDQAVQSDVYIRQILKNEPRLLQAAIQNNYVAMLVTPMDRIIHVTDTPFLRMLKNESKKQTAAADKALVSLRVTLFFGILLGAGISVVLTVLFCFQITNRLLVILQNTVNLSRGSRLSPPLAGSDEISELDQFLFKSGTEIRELERFKKEMIGVVSHELKSPLSSVGGFLQALGAGVYGKISAKAQEKAERTGKSVKRLMGLVGELLYLDKLELEMNPKQVAVDDLITASVDSVRELSEQFGMEIVVESEGGFVYADRDRMVQVLVNLLSNAMKFSPEAGKVTVTAKQIDGCFEFRVRDEGPGIPEEFRLQIFEPFKQVDAKDAVSKKGTGLGLTICRSIVEQHGGRIGVDSEPGKGSTFWYQIPVSGATSDNKAQAKRLPEGLKQSSMTSLIQPNNTRNTGKFKVLQQGLVIIAVPLVFQISLGWLIWHMLDQTNQQISREKNSTKILYSLNHMAQLFDHAVTPGIMSMVTHDRRQWRVWQDAKDKIHAITKQVEKACAGNPEELKEIASWRITVDKVSAMADSKYAAIGEQIAHGGGIVSLLANSDEHIRDLRDFYVLTFDAFRAQERLMARERAVGLKLAAQRMEMIKQLETTLLAGIIVNIVLSILLSMYLMRNLTNRLQHVTDNTARLVKRLPLDPPLRGSDEIAYLDNLLFETGSHLLQLEKFKQDLISIVSHELRTPLLSISSALELFASGVMGELSEKGSLRLKIAKEEANRLIGLINDLLDIEKMEAGKFTLDCRDCKVSGLIERAIASVAQLAEDRSITVDTLLAEPDLIIKVDGDRLCQVLINFLSNAVKFSPENDTIKVTVERSGDAELKFCVIDHGRGIPDDKLEKVFDRFVQVEETDASERGGSGLGLAISKAIVEQHGGSIGVNSALGGGSTFWFRLPRRQNY